MGTIFAAQFAIIQYIDCRGAFQQLVVTAVDHAHAIAVEFSCDMAAFVDYCIDHSSALACPISSLCPHSCSILLIQNGIDLRCYGSECSGQAQANTKDTLLRVSV